MSLTGGELKQHPHLRPLPRGWCWGRGMGRTPDELLGMGKVAGKRGQAVPCGVSTDCTSPLTDEHLGRFQTLATVLENTIIAQLLLNFIDYVSRIGVETSALFIPSSVHPPSQPASQPSLYASIHSLIHPSIHPPTHPLPNSSSHPSTHLPIHLSTQSASHLYIHLSTH